MAFSPSSGEPRVRTHKDHMSKTVNTHKLEEKQEEETPEIHLINIQSANSQAMKAVLHFNSTVK